MPSNRSRSEMRENIAVPVIICPPRVRAVSIALASMASLGLSPLRAETGADDLAAIKRDFALLHQQLSDAESRIAELEERLAARAEPYPTAPTTTAAPARPASAPALIASSGATSSPLQISGDIRVRYELNVGDRDARDRGRGVLRARLRGSYDVNDWLTVGTQIATGDPDDPNSSDVTLSNFADDLQVSLDRAYVRAEFGELGLTAGKFALPFDRTDLVWDSDVNPQGASADYSVVLGGDTSLKIRTLYFLVDEAVAGPDSSMIGAQLALKTKVSNEWHLALAASYYDYSLRSFAGADGGDFRSNRMSNGAYLSDFDLIEVLGSVSWQILGKKWPLSISGDYVRNVGASGKAEDGFELDLIAGRSAEPGDWRFAYGYAEVERDAVLAAFSHDNTGIATNYLQHTLSADYVLSPGLQLNATYYRYRPKDPSEAGLDAPDDWLNRLRLNLLASF